MHKYFLFFLVLIFSLSGCTPATSSDDNVDDLLVYKGTYVGDASSVSSILSLLDMEYDGFV